MSAVEAAKQLRLMRARLSMAGLTIEDVVKNWPGGVRGIDEVISVHSALKAIEDAAGTALNWLMAEPPDDFERAVEASAAARVAELSTLLDKMTDRYLEVLDRLAA